MSRTLFGKFLVVLLAFGVMMTAIFAAVIQLSHENYHLELDQRAASALAPQIAMRINGVNQGGPGALQPMLEELASANTGVDLYVLDNQGRILASSVAPVRIQRDRVEMVPVRRYLKKDAHLPILGVDPTEPSRDDVFSAAQIAGEGNSTTYLYALLHRREHQAGAGWIKASYLLDQGLWIAAAGTLFAILASLGIARMLTWRLGRLSVAMEKFRQSGFTEPPELRASPPGQAEDEVAQLGQTFAVMAQRIVLQMRELKRMEAMRREFLADVSHDLRVPLTSMQGRLETLTREEATLSEDDRRECLEIATSQTRRMAKLVSKLFELAKLEAQSVALEPELFALPDIVEDVMRKYSLAAVQKGVSLQTQLPEHLPLAYGDIGLIERVFDNLVENALHHTPAGGSVEVRLAPANQGVIVEVSDTGRGIPSEDLPRIFDRRGGEGGRTSGSDGAGLGLAIVKGILALHGMEIHVVSTIGIGTTFQFELPARAAVPEDAAALLARLCGSVQLRQGRT